MKSRDPRLRQAAQRRGRRVEFLATLMLRLKGYRILGRRVRTKLGEIDLIARSRSGILCFVEVKLRQTDSAALDSVRFAQQTRIARAAQLYITRHPALGAKGVRFDVVAVGSRKLPRHFPAAWHPEDWRGPIG